MRSKPVRPSNDAQYRWRKERPTHHGMTTARTELIRLQGELADVRPHRLAFVQAFPASRQIEVVTGGKRMRVSPSLRESDVTDLSYGQWVRRRHDDRRCRR